jgi:glycosyltransferase involved in cell wall biosynthesis
MSTPPPPPASRAGRRALLYCTFNGAANCTNGIGRQTQTLLGALSRRWDELTAAAGPFTPFLAIPAPGPATWAYHPARLAGTRRILAARGGDVVALDHDTAAPFWSPKVWKQLSDQAAQSAARLAARYGDVAVIAVDTPFAGTGAACFPSGLPPAARRRVRVLLALYGTARLHSYPRLDYGRLAWEHQALAAAAHPRVHVADIGTAFTRHLIQDYDLDPARLLPGHSALDLTAPDLQPMPRRRAEQVAASHGVPLDRPIVLAVARTDPVKGIDQLITALAPIRDLIHLVAIVVPFDGHDPLTRRYQQLITAHRLRATYIPRFTRELPRALASLPSTAVVACPSRAEALANLPLEAALWARCAGPIVVAPNLGSFPETITDQQTGLLYDPARPDGLTAAVRQAITLDPHARQAMCQAACERVIRERDIVPALADTLTRLFPAPAPATR